MICPICGTEFEPYRNNQKYCSPACNKIANRNYARNNYKNYRPKNKKHKCMMCGLNRCDGKYEIVMRASKRTFIKVMGTGSRVQYIHKRGNYESGN